MDEHILNLLHEFIAHSSENGDLTHLPDYISVGFVVNNDDPLQQGRLQIFCPAYNDDPKKLLHLPWSAYVSPVGGVISQSAYARGHIQGSENSVGPVHYGFWGIPEIGAHAIVACINGDPRRRIWLGCLPSHQETHTLGHGRFKHAGNAADGPLTSEGNPIQPTYTKLQEAFGGDTTSPEWKTRGADYQITSVEDVPSPDKSVFVDDDLGQIQGSEGDAWVKDRLGAHGYDWTGFKNLGSFLASRVFAWSTPGFHSITMDDRPFNSRIRIRTTGGAQIILDDTNERIYMSPSGGKSWVELDSAGNIDMYSERNISMHAEKTLNLSGGESVRIRTPGFISLAAGEGEGSPLDSPLANGEIRIHAQDDMHITTDKTLRFTVAEDMLGSVTQNLEMDVAQSINLQSSTEMYLEAASTMQLEASDVNFRVDVDRDTTIGQLVAFLDDLVTNKYNDLVTKYNSHTHPGVQSGPSSTGTPSNSGTPDQNIPDASLPENPTPTPDETMIAPWTNRVPMAEPWPRVMMIDSGDAQNAQSSRPENNVAWIEQYNNEGEAGREPVGKVEGQDMIDRGPFWRR